MPKPLDTFSPSMCGCKKELRQLHPTLHQRVYAGVEGIISAVLRVMCYMQCAHAYISLGINWPACRQCPLWAKAAHPSDICVCVGVSGDNKGLLVPECLCIQLGPGGSPSCQ